MVYSTQRDKLYQFSWRPRMPSLLPPEKEVEIAKNLKQYSKRYDEEDEQLIMQVRLARLLRGTFSASAEWTYVINYYASAPSLFLFGLSSLFVSVPSYT